MTEQLPQVSKLAATIVEHQRLLEELDSEDRQWAIQFPKHSIGLFIKAMRNRYEKCLLRMPGDFRRFVVNYSDSRVDMLQRAHYRADISPDYEEDWFPISGQGRHVFEAALFTTTIPVPIDVVLHKLQYEMPPECTQWKHASLEHLAAFAAEYSDKLEVGHYLHAFGSLNVRLGHICPALFKDYGPDPLRRINTATVGVCIPGMSFLAVREWNK